MKEAEWRRVSRIAVVISCSVAGTVLVAGLPSTPAAAEERVHHLSVGESLNTLLGEVAAGDTVVLAEGTHPRQEVTHELMGVTIRGASRSTTMQGLELRGASNLALEGFTVTTPGVSSGVSAVRILAGSHHITLRNLAIRPLSEGAVAIHNWGGAPHEITIADSMLVGSQSSGTRNARGVYVGDVTGSPSSGWPRRITLSGNEISGFWSDAVHVAGVVDMQVRGNRIHSLQESEDHNDGVQSVGSLRLGIVGNSISSPAQAGSTEIPPDQGIMLGHARPARPYQRVVDTYVANNLIAHWRGKGIVLAGTEGTRITSNTVVRSGPGHERYAAPSLTVYAPAGAAQNLGAVSWGNVFDRQWFDTPTLPLVTSNCVTRGATARDVSTPLRFRDEVGFELAAGSPCIGLAGRAGRPDTPATDRLGRVRDRAPDAGAHEVRTRGCIWRRVRGFCGS